MKIILPFLLLLSSANAFQSPSFLTPSSLSTFASTARSTTTSINSTPVQTPIKPKWSPSSWKNYKLNQMPVYDDQLALEKAIKSIEKSSPLVFAGEVRNLHEQLAKVSIIHLYIYLYIYININMYLHSLVFVLHI